MGRSILSGSILRRHPVGCALGAAGFFWVLDGLLHAAGNEEGFLEQIFSTQAHALVPRIFMSALLLSMGFLFRAEQLRRRYERELAESARLAELSAAVGKILAQEEALHPMLQRCAQALVTHLAALFVRIWIVDPDEEVLVLRASAGRYTNLDGAHARIPLGFQMIGVIGREQRPALANQVVGNPLIDDQEWALREGIAAFAGHPLVVGRTLVGVMGAFARHPFSAPTTDWLATVAGDIALGVQRLHARDRILCAEDEWARTFDAMPDLVFRVDADFRVRQVNHAMLTRLGLEREMVVGKHCYTLMHDTARPPASCPHQRAIRDGRVHSLEIHEPHLGGDFLLSVSPLHCLPNCPGRVVCVARDVSERKRLEERLQEAASTDELTGLFNRRGFFTFAEKQVEIARRNEQAVGLVYLDLDRMKEINDHWGHKEGDRALREVADILRETFRKSDILGRIGGDEFVAFLPGLTDVAFPRAALSSMRQILATRNARGDRPFTLELSAGAAFFPAGVTGSLEELLAKADRDMYREKRCGRTGA